MSKPDIRLVKNKDIDYSAWDKCVTNSSTPLVSAQSWFLDIVSPEWNALIYGNYQYVMPLAIKRKLGISWLLQPIFAQQHGIFPKPGNSIQNKFLICIRDRFKYITINLHAGHSGPFPGDYTVFPRINYILNLSFPYEILKGNYSKHTHKQFKSMVDNGISVIKGLQAEEYIDLKAIAIEGIASQKTMDTLKQLIEHGQKQGNGVIYAAYTPENILCAAAFFLFSGNRVTYLNAVSTSQGKHANAMFKLVDQFIRDHAGLPLTLDFEGSIIPGIAHFYKRFGAQTEEYYCLKFNKLPVPLRWLKK